MVDAIIDYHYKPERKCVLECVGPNGEFIDNPAGRCVNPGHSMENSWFLMNEAIYSGNKALLEKALNILDCRSSWAGISSTAASSTSPTSTAAPASSLSGI